MGNIFSTYALIDRHHVSRPVVVQLSAFVPLHFNLILMNHPILPVEYATQPLALRLDQPNGYHFLTLIEISILLTLMGEMETIRHVDSKGTKHMSHCFNASDNHGQSKMVRGKSVTELLVQFSELRVSRFWRSTYHELRMFVSIYIDYMYYNLYRFIFIYLLYK